MCITWRKCCCCISLEVGTQIIGVLAIASNLLWMSFLSYTFVKLYDKIERTPDIRLPILVMAGVESALVVLNLVFAIVLTVGVFKKRPSLMWPWIVMAWVSGIFSFVTQLIQIVSAYNQQRIWMHGVQMLLATLYPLVAMYLSCVVNSRRRQMVAEYYASPVRFSVSRTNSYEKRVYVPVTTYQYND